jgi:hypothetical protein
VGNAGSAQGQLQRALERGNLVAAELAARELGRIPLGMSLELTALIALHEPKRGARAAARWLKLWLEETDTATIDTALIVAGYLSALGGQQHEWALSSLRDMSPRATSRPRQKARPGYPLKADPAEGSDAEF